MVQYAEELQHAWACATSGIRASSARGWTARSCKDGITAPHIVICNDYEFELIRQKTGMSEADVLGVAATLIVTKRRARQRRLHRRRQVRRAAPCRRIGSSIRPAWATRSAAGS